MKQVTDRTKGSLTVCKNEQHFKQLLFEHSVPPASQKGHTPTATLIPMGFPELRNLDSPVLCACHNQYKTTLYLCPRCNSNFCDIPVDCAVCGLTLVSSAHLARSYHHLSPVPVFERKEGEKARCTACASEPKNKIIGVCPKCGNSFCFRCDAFIHDVLRNCPGCG